MAAKKTDKKPGVINFAYDLIRQGKTNQFVLAAIQKKFPESNLKIGGVGWCRNKLRENGEKIKTNRELTEATKKPAKKAA